MCLVISISGSSVCQLCEICTETNVGQILPTNSTVGHLVSQIHPLSNSEAKNAIPDSVCFQ